MSPSTHVLSGQEAKTPYHPHPWEPSLSSFLHHRALVPGLPSIVHGQASDWRTVIRELFVAGHAVDVDDVDDRVLGAHPHLAVLRHHHTVLTGAKMEERCTNQVHNLHTYHQPQISESER